MDLQVKGLDSLVALLMRAGDDVAGVVRDSLEEVAYEVLKEAKKKTPVDTGFLKSSGEVEMKSDKAIVRFTAEYALPVHERVEVSHANGEAKFLEKGVNIVLSRQTLEDVLARNIRELFGV